MPFKKGAPKPANSGRQKGSSNKIPTDLRLMVMDALGHAGGVEYLFMQAFDNPQAFMGLVGKCMPKDLNLNANENLAELLRAARQRVDAEPQS